MFICGWMRHHQSRELILLMVKSTGRSTDTGAVLVSVLEGSCRNY